MAKLRSQKEAKQTEVEVANAPTEEAQDTVIPAEKTVDSVVDKAVKNAEKVSVKKEASKAEAQVRIKPNRDLNTYIGNQWYVLKAGKQISVPKTVKDILQRAGYLDVL